jgi:hypothetical protein
MKTLWWIVTKIMSGNNSDILSPCDLDLWLSDPKIDKGLPLVNTNQYLKHVVCVMNTFQDNQRKPFRHLWPMWVCTQKLTWLCLMSPQKAACLLKVSFPLSHSIVSNCVPACPFDCAKLYSHEHTNLCKVVFPDVRLIVSSLTPTSE